MGIVSYTNKHTKSTRFIGGTVMFKKELIRRIEVARGELNNAKCGYEQTEDKEEIIHLSEKLDELIVEYMQITKQS